MRRVPIASLSLGTLVLVVHFLYARETLALDMHTPSFVQMLSCHWVHWSTEHLIWSGGVFVLLGSICELNGRGRYFACLVLSSLFISAALLVFPGDYSTYGGLSGVDSALFGLLLFESARAGLRSRQWSGAIAAIGFATGFIAKVGFELVADRAFFVAETEAMVPVPLAHLAGLAAGLATGIVWASRSHRTSEHPIHEMYGATH